VQRLAEGEHREAALPQLRVREHRGVTPAIVQYVLIDLVGEDPDGPIPDEARQRVQILPVCDRAAGILRTVDDDESRAAAEHARDMIPIVVKRGGAAARAHTAAGEAHGRS